MDNTAHIKINNCPFSDKKTEDNLMKRNVFHALGRLFCLVSTLWFYGFLINRRLGVKRRGHRFGRDSNEVR